jgi:sugar (pentulose or hexulose) kinase
MHALPVIAVFDIGRTNKKRILFDSQYRLLEEQSVHLPETTDEEGFPAEDLSLLTAWVKESFAEIGSRKEVELKAVNVSAYGASFVHLNSSLQPLTPLYNYLKPFSAELQETFNAKYDANGLLAGTTASPELGHLNSGMQLYWLKKSHPRIFNEIKYSLHLPQYISFLFSHQCVADLTSIGCHTRLWDFDKQRYHSWVKEEGLLEKFPAIRPGDSVYRRPQDGIPVGIGLHDSSAALIPYLSVFDEPFILISTGTWSISLNPFNHSPLTEQQLKQDCLCYLSFQGKPVKASRFFAGYQHDLYVEMLTAHFQRAQDDHHGIKPDIVFLQKWLPVNDRDLERACASAGSFETFEEAYHAGMIHLLRQQKKSTERVMEPGQTKKIFVDGGFCKNELFMYLMAICFPEMEVYAASLAQASALGAALSIHQQWNPGALPDRLPDLERYSA